MNFALILFVLLVVTGALWLAEVLIFKPRRRKSADAAVAEFDSRRAEMEQRYGVTEIDQSRDKIREEHQRMPWWLEYTATFFPVILFVFCVRSFVVEPFKIPSGSMIPTLLVGDLILVNKYHYGVRLPIINLKVLDNHTPERGDVMVFRYPKDETVDYIKRVVGVPGDVVSYQNKQLSINGKPLESKQLDDFFDEDRVSYSKQYSEQLGNVEHHILIDPKRDAYIPGVDEFPFKENCQYNLQGVICKVPEGHYFMMGDNRDNSLDSRYWGFVPDKNIVGKAFFIWMNLGNVKRIGAFH